MNSQYDIITEMRELEKTGKINNENQDSLCLDDNNYLNNKLFDEKLLNDVFNSISEGISILNKDLEIIKVNTYMKQLYNHKLPFIGKKCFDVYQDRNKICPWCPSLECIETKSTCTTIVPYPNDINPSGWLSLSAYPLTNEQGDVYGVIENVKDITQQKKIESELVKSTEKYQGLFDTNPEGILVLDNKGYATDINQAGLDLFGVDRGDIVGKHFLKFKVIRLRDIPKYSTLFFDIIQEKEKGPITIEIINNKTKKPIFAEVYLNLIKEKNKVIGLQVVSRDITSKKKADELLRDSQQRYHNLFHNAADLIAVIDTKGNFIDLNRRFEEESGYEKTEMIGKSMFNTGIISKKSALKTYPYFLKIMKGKEIPIIEIEGITKDGSIIPYELRAVPLFDRKKVIGAQAILRNLSERKKAEKTIKQEQIFSDSILRSLPGIFYFFDKNGRFIRWNKNFETITEYTSDEIAGITPLHLFEKEEKHKIAEKIEEVFKKGQSYVEGNLLSKSGKKTPFYFTGYHITIDDSSYLIGIGINLTDLKRTQIELQKTHDELKQLTKDLEKKVEDRTNQIQQLLKQKDEFINQLGHDLKNPMGPLISLLPILEKNEEDPKKKEILEIINRNVSYMKNLVTKTIQLAQLRSPNCDLHYEKINLSSEIKEILTINKLLFEQHHIEVINNIKEDVFIDVDKLRLHEVLTNIINNAVKYSDKQGGKIFIDHSLNEHYITLSIRDTGIGMTGEQQEMIFNEFYKADSSRHDFDSSGLGMAITKRIIEMHGGQIWVESKGRNKGTTILFTLPILINNT